MSMSPSPTAKTGTSLEPSPQKPAGDALRTLTSGQKKAIRGGCLQAHVCAVRSVDDVNVVMQRLLNAEQFCGVANWSYAYILSNASSSSEENLEGLDDGVDEGSAEKILGVLHRFQLSGLLLVVSRWNDAGCCCGLESLGTVLYSSIVERCKDLITGLQNTMSSPGSHDSSEPPRMLQKPEPQTFNFASLPPPVEPNPNLGSKYCPNHFKAGSLEKSQSVPQLLGGDPQQWVAHDKYLQNLLPEELQALRALRQPHPDVLRVLESVALLKGAWAPGQNVGNAAAQWGRCREMLHSPTFLTELLLLDSARIPARTIQSARQVLSGLDTENARRLGNGVVALLDWAQYVVGSRCAGYASEAGTLQRPGSDVLPRYVKPADAVLRTSGAMMMSKGTIGEGVKSAPGRSRSTTMLNPLPNRAHSASLILGRPKCIAGYMRSSRGFS
eukprot:gnl/MRDRNA2_/MRDRNA2_131455_c0_seq1.p1 gnl/MRDRNA2_/MRDRNA2_131455_c0~~gnl/MRDRNA2_/MRDRNA2_131455_c0_seq1.p1  ORF type:complete len:442 (+),score=69.43 gnl/MRDRNA2_/MRDRNA2_131455_c0_seq1:147-1472(+)